MKKRIRLTKKAKIGLIIILGSIVLGGAFLTFPRIFKQSETEHVPLEPPTIMEVEEPILKILDLESTTRPIAIMINNHNQARKYHAGLQEAYMIYEMIVEGGLTRLLALYKDATTEKIGSIRSARHYYLDYVAESDAVYVHWGYSKYAMDDMKKLGIDHIDGMSYGTKYFWKDKTLNIATEHTAFSSMEKIKEGIQALGLKKQTAQSPLLNYSIDSINIKDMEGAIPASQVVIKYSGSMTTSYEYDKENLNYKRLVNNAPHMDYEKNFQYTTKNIITYQVKNTTISGDEKGRQEINNIGNGEGYYISEGYAIPITWEKKTRTGKTIYKLKNGNQLLVNDGNTYIQIQPVGQNLTIS